MPGILGIYTKIFCSQLDLEQREGELVLLEQPQIPLAVATMDVRVLQIIITYSKVTLKWIGITYNKVTLKWINKLDIQFFILLYR